MKNRHPLQGHAKRKKRLVYLDFLMNHTPNIHMEPKRCHSKVDDYLESKHSIRRGFYLWLLMVFVNSPSSWSRDCQLFGSSPMPTRKHSDQLVELQSTTVVHLCICPSLSCWLQDALRASICPNLWSRNSSAAGYAYRPFIAFRATIEWIQLSKVGDNSNDHMNT